VVVCTALPAVRPQASVVATIEQRQGRMIGELVASGKTSNFIELISAWGRHSGGPFLWSNKKQ
jgi:hypothetical protein